MQPQRQALHRRLRAAAAGGALRRGAALLAQWPTLGESEDAYTERLAGELEALIEAEGPETFAGFFAEPVMGAGGAVPPPAGYFPKIQAVLNRHGIRWSQTK